jgi:hypothetical protein
MKNRIMCHSLSSKSRKIAGVCTTLVLVILGACFAWTQDQGARAPSQSASEFVAGIYTLVSSAGGKLPDWDMVRGCFLKEAVVVLRSSRTTTTVFSLDGFIKDFVDFYERPYRRGEKTFLPKESGFTEKVVNMRLWEYGDMAHALVLYEAHITGTPMAPQQGVDSWLLVRRDGRWRIAAVTNEIVTAERPAPPELRTEIRKH